MSDPFLPVSPRASTSPGGSAGSTGNAESVEHVESSTPSDSSSAAIMKFKSCRWRRPPEDGPECCGHRDVLPIAGTSFKPDAWCPDCTFFKLRRTPKKRSPDDYRY